MVSVIEKTGKTIEEAYEAALAELGASRENTTMEVITEPKKGLFGFFGTDAKVRVTLKATDPIATAETFLKNLFRLMNIDLAIEITEGEEAVNIHLAGDNLGLLIGKHGQTLDSLQYLTNLAANCGVDENRRRIFLDVEDYRARREETLQHLARRLAEKARKYGEKIVLEPMNCHERKIIHLTLQDDSRVKTYSSGDEPHRRVIIEPKTFERSEERRRPFNKERRERDGGYRGYRDNFKNDGYKAEYQGGYKDEGGDEYIKDAAPYEADGETAERGRGFKGRFHKKDFGGGFGGKGGFKGRPKGRGRRFEKSPYTDPNYEPDFSMFNESRIQALKKAEEEAKAAGTPAAATETAAEN